jgi:NitT/TauT family transport system ATP-binding protein
MTLHQGRANPAPESIPHAPAPSAGIEVRRVGKTYRVGQEVREVVKDCSFQIEPGKISVMIGPSGAGKSTLIRLIAGFERPSSGEVLVNGKPVVGPGRDRLVMFQETSLFPWMTTRENVAYGPKARSEYTPEARRACEHLMTRMGLDGFRGSFPSQLSGGMQRKTELARALVNAPSVLILDEPFRGLDSMTKRLMLEYYATLSEESQSTTFFVTTDIDEAIFLADRLLVMTNIPTRVRKTFEVDLPRPRRLAALLDDPANDLKAEVLALLHDEAAKSFAGRASPSLDFADAYARRTGPPTSSIGRQKEP